MATECGSGLRHARSGYLPLAGGDPQPIPALGDDLLPAGWTESPRALFARPRDNRRICPVYRVDLTSGARTLWKELGPQDPTGTPTVTALTVAADGRSYAYTYARVDSDLFLVSGVYDYARFNKAGFGAWINEANIPNLQNVLPATLEAFRLPMRLLLPFLLLIGLSWITPRNRKETLDRYYVKMKTIVARDPEEDRVALEASYRDPARFDHLKLFPRTNLEFCRPTRSDLVGVAASFAVCFAIIGLLVWLAGIGAS